MRPIKFRAWDKENKQMLTVYHWHKGFKDSITKLSDFTSDRILFVGEDCELMQYTGLKDKNGREIYEGDILEFEYHYDRGQWTEKKTFRNTVEWNELYCGFYPMCRTGEYEMPRSKYEVIGNIWESPELLEDKR